MNKVCREYLRQVCKSLRCTYKERKRLLSGLEVELTEAFPPETSSTMADLTARFGAPDAMAVELLTALPEGGAAEHQENRRKKWMIATAACIAVIVMLMGYLIWLESVEVDYIVDDGIVIQTDSSYGGN